MVNFLKNNVEKALKKVELIGTIAIMSSLCYVAFLKYNIKNERSSYEK